MKKTMLGNLVVAVLFCSIFFGLAFSADAEVKDLGEVCFDMLPGIIFEGVGGQLQVGVLSFGAGHFVLDGKIVPMLILEPHGRVHGTAFVDGDKITINLTSSNVTAFVDPRAGDVSFFHIELDAATLTGKYSVLMLRFTTGKESVATPRDVGTISIGPCRN